MKTWGWMALAGVLVTAPAFAHDEFRDESDESLTVTSEKLVTTKLYCISKKLFPGDRLSTYECAAQGPIKGVVLERNISWPFNACVKDRDWFYSERTIYVQNGCSALFRVTYEAK